MNMASANNHPSNQLDKVIFQIRFCPMLEIDRRVDEFQAMIRDSFPHYLIPEMMQMNLANVPVPIDHVFKTESGDLAVSLSVSALSLTSTNYSDWNIFRSTVCSLLNVMERLFKINKFTRVGLRYVNAIRPSSLNLNGLEDTLSSPFSGILSSDIGDVVAMNNIVEYRLSGDNMGRAVIGTIQFSDSEYGMLIDDDVYVERTIDINSVSSILDSLHADSELMFKTIASNQVVDKVFQ